MMKTKFSVGDKVAPSALLLKTWAGTPWESVTGKVTDLPGAEKKANKLWVEWDAPSGEKTIGCVHPRFLKRA